MNFRSDIEGLRAVAIIIVVACHAGFPGFQGGFSGVDVFFVLSGFLISGLLVNEFSQTGSIRLLNFYARRLKRLLPALLLMSVVTLGMTAVLLSPFEQMAQASTVVAVPLWITNFYFSFANVDYFTAEAGTNLFLHTWSLAVEEQFYLVWPVFILFLFGLGQNRQALTGGLVAVIGIGFLLSLFVSYAKPLWGFYLMPFRAWQFALGGLIFVLTSPASVSDKDGTLTTLALPERAYTLAGWTGLALIAIGVATLTEAMTYPGFGALIPSIGTALLLFAGAAPRTSAIRRFLSLQPMQAIGKVSYSWYLWHWPVLVLGNAVLPPGGLLQNLGLVVLALVLASVSLVTVEAPLRHSRTLSARPLLTVCASLVLMFSVSVGGYLWRQKAELWAQLPEQGIYQQVRSDMPAIYSVGCDEWYATARLRACSFGDSEAANTAVLLGDSVGAQWFSALAKPLVDQGWRFVVLTKSACPIVDEPIFYSRIGMMYTVCSEWRTAALGFVAELQPDIVFIGSTSTYDYSPAQWLAGTSRVLDVLSPAAAKLYIIQGTYRLPFDGPNCLAQRDWQPGFLQDLSDCTAAGPDAKDATVADALGQAAAAYTNVGVLDLNPLICPDERCAARIGEHIVFRDYQHIANRFAEVLIPEIQASIARVQFGAAGP